MARRTKGTGSIVRRKDGRWEARLRGQSYYLKTKLDAERKLREGLNLIDKGIDPTPETLTVGTWLDQWLEGQRPAVRVGTFHSYRQIVNLHLKPHLGDKRLNRLRPVDVSAMMTALSGDGHGLADSTIRQIRGVLKAALNSAIEEGKLARNVAKSSKGPAEPDQNPFVPTPELARAIVEAAGEYSDELRRAVVFGFGTALRAGEQAGLKWQDVNLDGGYLRVRQQLTRTYDEERHKPTDLKTKNSRRRIDLAPSIVATLRAERATQDGSEGYVFRDAQGNPRTNDPRRLQAALKRAGLLFRADTGKPLSWDACCREGRASLLLQQGESPRAVADHLGNTLAVFMKHYAGVIPVEQVRLGSSLETLRIA